VIGAGLLKGRLGTGTGVPCPYMPSRVNWNDNIWAAGITRNGQNEEKVTQRRRERGDSLRISNA
jgi:hypothetical protein